MGNIGTEEQLKHNFKLVRDQSESNLQFTNVRIKL